MAISATLLSTTLLPASGPALADGTKPDLSPAETVAAPGFSLDALSGGRTDLADLRGRIVLLHFFATWCEPCRPEMASLERLRTRVPDDLAILAVSVAETEARLTRFFAASPVGFPILLDRDRRVSRAWDVFSLPTSFVLDRNSVPRLVVRGDLDWQRPEIEARLRDISAPADEPDIRPTDAG